MLQISTDSSSILATTALTPRSRRAEREASPEIVPSIVSAGDSSDLIAVTLKEGDQFRWDNVVWSVDRRRLMVSSQDDHQT